MYTNRTKYIWLTTTFYLTLMMTSFSGLHSPGRSNYTITCYPRVQTIYSDGNSDNDSNNNNGDDVMMITISIVIKAKYDSMKSLPKQFSEDLVRIRRFEVSALMIFRIVISRWLGILFLELKMFTRVILDFDPVVIKRKKKQRYRKNIRVEFQVSKFPC